MRGSLLVVFPRGPAVPPVSGQRALASPMAKRELEQRGPREDRSRLVGPTSATPIRRRRRTSFSGSLLEVVQLDNAAVQRKEWLLLSGGEAADERLAAARSLHIGSWIGGPAVGIEGP